jgi:putative ABC transport system permease protein
MNKLKFRIKTFTVIGIIKSVPDVSGFVAFGDWALAGKQTLEILKLKWDWKLFKLRIQSKI